MFAPKNGNDFLSRNYLEPVGILSPMKKYTATTYTPDEFAKPNRHIITLILKGASYVDSNPQETIDDPRVFSGNFTENILSKDSETSTFSPGGILVGIVPLTLQQKIGSANFPFIKAKL